MTSSCSAGRITRNSGGHLILTCRTGQKDRRGHLWEGPWAAPILDLIGAKIKFYDTLPAPNVGKVKAGEQTYDWVSWGEVLEPREWHDRRWPATPTNTMPDGVAAVTRKLGRGTVTYIGVDSQDGGLEAQLIREVFKRAGVAVENSTTGFLWTGAMVSGLPPTSPRKPNARRFLRGAKVLIGSRDVPAAGVTVWQE